MSPPLCQGLNSDPLRGHVGKALLEDLADNLALQSPLQPPCRANPTHSHLSPPRHGVSGVRTAVTLKGQAYASRPFWKMYWTLIKLDQCISVKLNYV